MILCYIFKYYFFCYSFAKPEAPLQEFSLKMLENECLNIWYHLFRTDFTDAKNIIKQKKGDTTKRETRIPKMAEGQLMT